MEIHFKYMAKFSVLSIKSLALILGLAFEFDERDRDKMCHNLGELDYTALI